MRGLWQRQSVSESGGRRSQTKVRPTRAEGAMKYARRDLLAGAAALMAVPVSAGSSGTATEAIRSVIERYADAWQRRDPAAFALYHPQFTIHWFGHNPLSGTHVGAQTGAARARRARASHESQSRQDRRNAGRTGARRHHRAREFRHRRCAHRDGPRAHLHRRRRLVLRECWVYDADPTCSIASSLQTDPDGAALVFM